MPVNCYTCRHRTGEYACAHHDLKVNPCVNFSRWESKHLTLQEACEIARKDRERIETALKEEVVDHVHDIFCDCKTVDQYKVDVLQHNCSNCKDTVCARQGDKNYICSGWCADLKKKEVAMDCNNCKHTKTCPVGTFDFNCPASYVFEKKKTCATCMHATGTVWKPVCMGCEWWPYKTGKDNWEAALPEKHENLTWHEADKLWHEGWDMGSVSLKRDGLDGSWTFDSSTFETKAVRATDWYIIGRRKT